MDQGKFDEAEVVLRKAFTANPRFREAQYNLAQIPFREENTRNRAIGSKRSFQKRPATRRIRPRN